LGSNTIEQPLERGHIESLVRKAGFGDLSDIEFETLSRHKPRGQLLSALECANTNETANAYLSRVLNKTPDQQAVMSPEASADKTVQETPHSREGVKHIGHHVYGNSALYFAVGLDARNSPALNIEGAVKTGKHYDWDNKIALQLKPQETVQLLAVLYRYSAACEFTHHGADQSKAFYAKKQDDGSFYFKLIQAEKKAIQLNAGPGDAYFISALLVKILKDCTPWLNGVEIHQLLEHTQTHGGRQ
jgi:hypothetical protein